MAFHAILAPYDLDRLRQGNGAGPDALVSDGALSGFEIATTTTVELTDRALSQVQHCIAIDAAIAKAVRPICDAGDVPVVFSGNCHACLGSLSGIGARTSIIWFDAHGDLNTPETTETGYFDGMALATALGWGWTAMTRRIPGFAAAIEGDTLLAGGRDLDEGERQLLHQSGVSHHSPAPLAERVSPEFEQALAAPSRPRRVYVHLDLDVIDPSLMGANRFNAPGGVSVEWLQSALRFVRQRHDIAAVGVAGYDPAFAAPATAAPIVNRLLRALLHTDP